MAHAKRKGKARTSFLDIVEVGQQVAVWGFNYIYTGTVAEWRDGEGMVLDPAAIVYETGPFHTKHWKDAQLLPGPVMVFFTGTESIMVTTKQFPTAKDSRGRRRR